MNKSRTQLIKEAKVLGEGEVGFGILIESDAGYIDKSLNNHLLTEGFKFEEGKPILINCILQKHGVKNKNGRIYPSEVLIPEVQRYMEMVELNSALSEADHPESSVISLQNISHGIKKMWWGNGENANVLYGTLEIITSPGYHKFGICSMVGDKILRYIELGYRIGISSRGVGSLREVRGQNLVQKDYELIGFDLVHSPSTPGAYLFPNTPTDSILTSSSLSEFTTTEKKLITNTVNEEKKSSLITEKYKKVITKLDNLNIF